MISCKKEEDTIKLKEGRKVEFIDVSSYSDWIYFSFSKGEVVEITDYQSSLDWDIAFHRGDIRTNGGVSGIGASEVINSNEKDWEKVSKAPDFGYSKDEIGLITISFTGEGVIEEEQPYSPVLSTWLEIDTSNPPPVYIISNWIYVTKTSDGKYVKLQIFDNKNEKDKAGYVSFRYLYNADGSEDF